MCELTFTYSILMEEKSLMCFVGSENGMERVFMYDSE